MKNHRKKGLARNGDEIERRTGVIVSLMAGEETSSITLETRETHRRKLERGRSKPCTYKWTMRLEGGKCHHSSFPANQLSAGIEGLSSGERIDREGGEKKECRTTYFRVEQHRKKKRFRISKE